MDSSFFRKYLCPTPVSDTYSDIGMILRSFKYMEKLTKIKQYPCRTHTRIRHLYPSPCNIAHGGGLGELIFNVHNNCGLFYLEHILTALCFFFEKEQKKIGGWIICISLPLSLSAQYTVRRFMLYISAYI